MNVLELSGISVGKTVRFADEPTLPYVVQAMNERYAVLTRTPSKEDLEEFGYDCADEEDIAKLRVYTIVDGHEWIRGTTNSVFGAYDFSDQAQCVQCCADLLNPPEQMLWLEISRRNRVPVQILL